MSSSPNPPTPARRGYIDCLRGVAVLIMIQAHAFDAWTGTVDRGHPAFRNLMVIGGFGAPLFLWLAGVAVVLSAEHAVRRTGSRRAAAIGICRRGVEIFLLAFLFRLQAFVVSPGDPLIALFRVDILNIMGPSIVLAGLAWGLWRNRVAAALAYTTLAIVLAMAAPLVRTAGWVDILPIWLQWYLRPAGEHTTFTLLPWAGFVCAGGAVGVLLAAAHSERRERRVLWCVAAAGAALIVLGFFTAARPSIYAQSSFWTSSPTYFSIRAGVMMAALAATYLVAEMAGALSVVVEPLKRLGRSSLFVYWIHVELVYGYATWPLRQHLPLWAAAVALVGFGVLIYGALVLRDGIIERCRGRQAMAPLFSNS